MSKVTVKLDGDQMEMIIAASIKEDIERFRWYLEAAILGTSQGMFDCEDADLEAEQLQEHINAFKIVGDYYGVNW